MVVVYKVVWDKEALNQLREAYQYIRRNSLQNAEKVKSEILLKTAALKTNPTKHAADKHRTDKDKSFRAFELYHYRIAYHIDDNTSIVTILRVRHSSQEPLEY